LAAAYYLRLALAAAQRGAGKNADTSAPVPQVGIAVGAALFFAVAATLALGIVPNTMLHAAENGALTLEAPTPPAGAAGISAVQESKP
jgi:NADH:ubiquinone oxidoreductase subunit 2 (subunit N)